MRYLQVFFIFIIFFIVLINCRAQSDHLTLDDLGYIDAFKDMNQHPFVYPIEDLCLYVDFDSVEVRHEKYDGYSNIWLSTPDGIVIVRYKQQCPVSVMLSSRKYDVKVLLLKDVISLWNDDGQYDLFLNRDSVLFHQAYSRLRGMMPPRHLLNKEGGT